MIGAMVKIVIEPFFEASALILKDGADGQIVLGHVVKI
jgi:hypothetical protein